MKELLSAGDVLSSVKYYLLNGWQGLVQVGLGFNRFDSFSALGAFKWASLLSYFHNRPTLLHCRPVHLLRPQSPPGTLQHKVEVQDSRY